MTLLSLFTLHPSLQPTLIKQAIAQINHAHRLFLFTSEESHYIRTRNKAFRSYRDFLEKNQSVPDELRGFIHSHKKMEQQIQQKNKRYQWKKQRQRWLADEKIWGKLIQDASDKEEAEKLKSHWQSHGALSRWSHQTLLYIATELLPQLVDYYQKEFMRCQQNAFDLPPDTAKAYRGYITQFLAEADSLKRMLAESLLARLRALAANQFQHADVTVEMLSQLQALNSLSPNTPLPSAMIEPLTSKQFALFHGYLLQEEFGGYTEKLHELAWFSGQQSLIPVKQKNTFKTMLVPTDLIPFIPQTKRRLALFFKGHDFRRTFFKGKEKALASLVLETRYPLPLNLESIHTTLSQFQLKEKAIQDAIGGVSEKKFQFRRFWHQKTRHFLTAWGSWLQNQREKIIDEKIHYLEVAMNELQQKEQNDTGLAWEYYPQISTALEQLQQQCYPSQLKAPQIFKIKKMTETLSDRLLAIKAYHLVVRMAEGELPLQNEMELLNGFSQATLAYHPQRVQTFCEILKPHLQKIQEKIHRELSTFSFKNRKKAKLQNHINKVLCFNYALQLFATPEQKASLQNRTLKYLLHYLEALLQADWTSSHEAIEAVETNLLLVGKAIPYGATSVDVWVEELRSLRKNAQWGGLAIKAKSLFLMLNHNLLKNRLLKESAFLDQGISAVLQNDPKLNYSQSAIDAFFALRNQMVAAGTTDVNQIKNIPKYQQTLFGIACQQTEQVQAWLKISAKAHKALHKLQSEKFTYTEKEYPLEKLTHSVAKVFSRTPGLYSSLQRNSPFFKQRTFFTKRYANKNVSPTFTR